MTMPGDTTTNSGQTYGIPMSRPKFIFLYLYQVLRPKSGELGPEWTSL